jgi:hypothetical protein
MAEQLPFKQWVAGSNPARLTWEGMALHTGARVKPFSQEGVAMARRVAFPTDWVFYPTWLTVEQACYLSGWNADDMQEIMDAGGVDLNDAGLIAKDSLWDFQKVCALLFHWYD